MVSSREVVRRVMNFKPVGLESEELNCWCVFLGHEGDMEQIATHETIIQAKKDEVEVRDVRQLRYPLS